MNTYTIGIDIGGTNTDIGIVRDDGLIVGRSSIPTDRYNTAETYMEAIATLIQQLLSENNIAQLQGIGIGAPNGNPHTVSIEANTANLRIKTAIPLGDYLACRCSWTMTPTPPLWARWCMAGPKVCGIS